MEISYLCSTSLNDRASYKEGVLELLKAADEEFIPALHYRTSTRQRNLSKEPRNEKERERNLKSYFDMMSRQSIVLALSGEKVVGFLSYRSKAWKRVELFPKHYNYISTIIVDKSFRGQHIGEGLYDKLFSVCGKDARFMTRTWETNSAHQTILHKLHFGLAKKIHEGRKGPDGVPVATVYYCRPMRQDAWALLRQYQLLDNLTIAVLLFVLALVFLGLACFLQVSELAHELFIAVMTSFFASSFAMGAEVLANYRLNKSKEFMERIGSYRIDNIDHDKVRLMREQLAKCRHEVCISGYKLRVTTEMRADFANPLRRGAVAKILLCPPWTAAYKCVYKNDPCMKNFYLVFKEMMDAAGGDASKVQVSVTEEVLFSDTYRFDGTIVTGAFMHDATAQDFITYVTHDEKSIVFRRTNAEVEKLFKEGRKLNVGRFLALTGPNDDEAYLAERMQECLINDVDEKGQ